MYIEIRTGRSSAENRPDAHQTNKGFCKNVIKQHIKLKGTITLWFGNFHFLVVCRPVKTGRPLFEESFLVMGCAYGATVAVP